MSKNKVTVRFRDLHQLWQFAQTIKARSIEIIPDKLLLLCECSEDDLRLAENFGGQEVQHTAKAVHG
jgi:hypothetical protein